MKLSRRLTGVAILFCLAVSVQAVTKVREEILGQERIIAFTYIGEYDPKELRSLTFFAPARPGDRTYWRKRGVVPAVGQTWYDLLKSPVDKAVDILINLDYGGDPNPVVCIDEFGFDYGGLTDQKSARILRLTKKKKPELNLTVWQMRGPISHVLAAAYRDVVSLVLMEAYIGDKRAYWWIATQVYVARMHGLLEKSIVALGLSPPNSKDEQSWASTEKEVEQQLRFVRLIAPESPGVGFFAPAASPELLRYADKLCERFHDIPTDGTGLPEDVLRVHRLFTNSYDRPTLVTSPVWVEPNREESDPNILVLPHTMRIFLLNIGDKAAQDVKVRLRNPEEEGGEVFAEGELDFVPEKYGMTAVLSWTKAARGWKMWDVEIEADGCDILIFRF
ncbi:MAG: hypothetical protein PVI11_02655 [Candidatus Aminicenantes bacterium]|jgi:hypothetical protein